MTFFDRKEEVIQIELTQYGKYLLSKGKFKPAYYSFFDDDIVYDSQYAGFNESQDEIQTRIKETVRIKPQYTFSGAETQMKRNVELIRSGKEKDAFAERFIQTPEKHYSLSAPLGTSDISNDKSPAWNINFLKGEISKTIRYSTGSHPTLVIPQISVLPIVYETFPAKSTKLENIEFQDNGEAGGISDLNLASKRFEDGSFIQIKDDYILIDVKEENVQNRNDNFDIEVYLIDRDNRRDGTSTENLVPLYFPKKKPEVVNGILVDNVEDEMVTMLGPSFVNHFFNVFVDREINPDTLCRVLSEDEIRALTQSGEYVFDCAGKNNATLTNPKLMSDVTPEDIEEKC
jgi:hypothetical protein